MITGYLEKANSRGSPYTYPGFIAPRTYSISTTLPDETFSVPFAINYRTECSRLDHRRKTGNDHQGIVGCVGRRLQRRDKQSPCYTRAAIQNETQTEHAMMIRMFRDTLFMGGKIPENVSCMNPNGVRPIL